MRVVLLTGFAALVATSAFAEPLTALQREKAIWQSVRDKNIRSFAAKLAPDFVSVYGGGVNDKAGELAGIRGIDLRSFTISDFRTRRVNSRDELITYLLDMSASTGKVDISGRFWTTSLWHRRGGDWTIIYHSEVKAN